MSDHLWSAIFSVIAYYNAEIEVLSERTCEADQAGENSSFIFAVCVKSVPLYHLKLAYVVLHIVVKEFFETNFQKWRTGGPVLILLIHFI